MSISAVAFLLALALERGMELIVSRRNETRMKALGAREYGDGFTRVLVLFHVLWLVSFAVEAFLRNARPLVPAALAAALFLILQGGRYWCVLSLGQHWNTKIIVLPGDALVRAGPYRFLKHPNYLVVFLELFIYPALFGCWATLVLFGPLHVLVLKKRIRQEEAALAIVENSSKKSG